MRDGLRSFRFSRRICHTPVHHLSKSMSTEKELLKALADGRFLTAEQMEDVVAAFLGGGRLSFTDAQVGAVLFALGRRLPSSTELAGAASAMRRSMRKVPIPEAIAPGPILDTAGTGGSGMNSFNTSTLAAIVLAAAGCHVVKHGNRSSTSACGSADLLEAFGVSIELGPEDAARSLLETGFCFCFAPHYHPATNRVKQIRKELGVRTIFNFLGPLTNPGGADCQLLGVSSPEVLPDMAEALLLLGVRRSLVVSGADGLDEITLSGPTHAVWIEDGVTRKDTLTPEHFGLETRPLQLLLGGTPAENLAAAKDILGGNASPRAELVAANAGAALVLAGKCASLKEGAGLATAILQSGEALAKLDHILRFQRGAAK